MEQSNGRWNWSLTTEHRGIYVRASRRVSGSGAFLGVTLRHKIGPTLYHDQSFALFWSEGYGGREKPFLYCGATIDAEDAASIICCRVEPGSPSVEAVEILVSDYVPYLGGRAVCIGLVLYDSQGREIARKTTAMPLAVNRNYFGFRLEGISFADFERVDVGMLQSPDEPCCARPPWIQCEDYEYASGQLNYLARPFFFLPAENARYQLLRADTIVKAPTDGGFLWELGLGDCCAGARFRIEVSRAAGDNRVTVSLIRECQHGGPVVMRQSRLAAANWDPTADYVDVPVSVCIRHIAVLFGDPQELFVDSVVSVNTPWGLVTWIGVFAYIDWSTTCAYNLGGFLYADLIVVDLMCGAGMTFTKALLDRCFCQAYPTPQPGLSKCLDLVCTGAPPQRDPPSGWLLSVSNLPDELQLLDWPQPVGEYISDCPAETECTAADWLTCGQADICDENPNRWPDEVAAMTDYVATHSSVPSGFPFGTCEVRTHVCKVVRRYPELSAMIIVELCVPIGTIDVFQADGEWPLFAIVSAYRGDIVRYEYEGFMRECECGAISEVVLAGMAPYPFCSGRVTLSERIYSFATKCYDSRCRRPDPCKEYQIEPPNLQGVTVTLTAVNE